jgi:hypothetical protein
MVYEQIHISFFRQLGGQLKVQKGKVEGIEGMRALLLVRLLVVGLVGDGSFKGLLCTLSNIYESTKVGEVGFRFSFPYIPFQS